MGRYISRASGTVVYRLLTGSTILLLVWAFTLSACKAEQVVRLGVRFTPDHLGASTTIVDTVEIATTTGAIPAPLTDIDVHLPEGMGLAATTLGTATCSASVLLRDGPAGCPSNSIMGYGRAEAAIPFGPVTVRETANIVTVMAKSVDHQTTLLFYADGSSPVAAELVFEDQLVGDTPPFGEQINTVIPEIPTVPGGADVALVRIESGIGPRSLVYYKHSGKESIPYRPVGMQIPRVCPAHGFPFRADLTFADGSHTSAATAVPCPTRRQHHLAHHAGQRK